MINCLFYVFNLKLIIKLHKLNFHKIFNKTVDNYFIDVDITKLNNFFLNFLIDKMKLNINMLNFQVILKILYQLNYFLIVTINDN